MTRYTMHKTAQFRGSTYRRGLTYVLDEDSHDALSEFCGPEGEPLPVMEPVAQAMRKSVRAHCDEVEAQRRAKEASVRAILSERRNALRRMQALESEVQNAVDEFETREG